jgi:hypothetical protein
VQRQQLHAAAVDLDVELVDRRVAGEDLLDQPEVASTSALTADRTRSSASPPISSSGP